MEQIAEKEAMVDGKLSALKEELIAHVEASIPKGRGRGFSRSKGQTSAMGLSSNPEINNKSNNGTD